MSEPIEIYKGIFYTLPNQPSKKDIAGYNLPKKQQKWKRTELPENFDELSNEEQEAFAYEEDRKCTDGYWFMCNGVPTYITGDHYHYLNWFKIDSGYPDYRDRDRRWFYHWQLCDKDDECLGQLYGKLRRDGYSYRVDSVILNRARKTFNANYGIISKTGEDAKEMFNKLVHGFIEYPSFFKPQIQSAEDVKKELVFKTPQQRITFKNRATKKEISLNTKIDWRNTKDNAYDGMKLALVAADESGKMPSDVKIEKWFNIGRTCLVLGSKIIGKMLMGSTVNEIDKGGKGFLTLWKQSDYTEKTENGRTITGLWRYFVPSYDGMEGFIDEYGQSVIDTPIDPIIGIDGRPIKKGAKQWIIDELDARRKAGDFVGYYEFKRQFPMKEDDMFINPADEKTCFDIDKIHQQVEHNDIHLIEKTLVFGYFSWKNGHRDCGEVEWNPVEFNNPLAKFCFAWLPPYDDRNKFKLSEGKRSPVFTHVGILTLDPYSAVNTDDGRGSKAASHAFLKFNAMATDKKLSDTFIGEYWNRPKDPLLVYEDMVMQCIFFSWGILGERNKNNWSDYFRGRGYEKYCLPAPTFTYDDFMEQKIKEVDVGLANVTQRTRQQLVEYLASYISNNVGRNEATGEMGYMPFNNTLRDWLKFDVNKWTPYDLTVSAMLAVTGSRSISEVTKNIRVKYPSPPKYKIFNGQSIRIRE